MNKTQNVIIKDFNFNFCLDRGKFSRILTIIENRFNELPEKGYNEYKVRLKSGKQLSLNDSEEVLSLDNSLKNPITMFSIHTSDKEKNDKNIAEIDFDRGKSAIHLDVNCEKAKWGDQLFAELEEQIERTTLGGTIYYLKKMFESFGVAIVSVCIGILFFVFILSSGKQSITSLPLTSFIVGYPSIPYSSAFFSSFSQSISLK